MFAGPAAAAVTPGVASSLSLSVLPIRLPADGNSYPALVVGLVDSTGAPSLGLNDTTVYLTSSEQNVGTVAASVVIPAGKGYVIANFTTTQIAGVTTITASAGGFRSSHVSIDTRIPSGYASQIRITPAPGDVLAGENGSLVVQLLDSTGAPARASSNVGISIFSSALNMVSPLSNTVTIKAGSNMAILNFTTGYELGATSVIASASSLVSGSASVDIIGPSPFSLSINAQPEQIATGTDGRVVVWLSGSVGHPARAPQNITVSLTSSNTTVATLLQTTLTIVSGTMSATAQFATTSNRGVSTITASASGLQSGFDTIQSYAPSDKPAGLKLFFAPNPVIADSVSYKAVLVAVVNSSGLPAESSSATVVNLASATTSIGAVPTTITIPAKTEFATATFNSTYQVGTTIITASAQNLVSAQIQTSTYGPIPSGVVLAPVSASLPANGGNYTALAIMLQDATGNPAVAPSDILVHLTSSNPSVLKVNSFVNIGAGESSVVTTVQTGIASGVSNISASAVGYKASFSLLTTVIPAPSGVALFIGPSTTVNSTAGSEAMLTAQLQDINGLPARANQPTQVTIVSSNTTVLKGPIILNINPGSDYATRVVNTSAPGVANLTASAAGLSSSFGILTVLANPVSVTLEASASIIPDNQSAFLTVKAVGLGTGIAGAQVQWSTSFGTLSNTTTTTNAAGESVVSLNPGLVANSATVKVTVSSPLTGTKSATVSVVFTPIVVPKPPSTLHKFESYILVIILVLVVAIAVVGFLIFRRRRAAKAPAEGEGAEGEQPYDELEEAPQVGEGEGDSGNEGVMLLRGSAGWRFFPALLVRRPD